MHTVTCHAPATHASDRTGSGASCTTSCRRDVPSPPHIAILSFHTSYGVAYRFVKRRALLTDRRASQAIFVRHNLITNSWHDEHRQRTQRSSPSATNDIIRDEHYTVRDERLVFVERTLDSSRTEADATVKNGRQYQARLSRAPYFVVRCVSLARTLSSPSMSCQWACPNMSGAVDA